MIPRSRALVTRWAAANSGRFCVAAGLSLLSATPARTQAKLPPAAQRFVDGRVVRPVGGDVRGVRGVWIVLHRVGSDQAAPLDSIRSAADGSFGFRYRPSGASDAIYFVSAQYGGIAYFSQPLRESRVTGEDAEITVFDTTSGPVSLRVRGRHLVVGAFGVDGAREVVEVYELSNDSSVTLVSPDDAKPTWSAMVPREADNFRAGQSDVSAEAVRFRDGRVSVIAPIAPGLKQISFSYRLAASSFPWSIPVQRATEVLEVLLEDSTATAQGAKLAATPPVSVEGRTFRRFVASEVPESAVIRITVPPAATRGIALYVTGLAVAIGAAMLLSLAKTFSVRSAPVPEHQVDRAPPPDDPDRIARVIASLDEEFERRGAADPSARAAYEEGRNTLKARLKSALDGGRGKE